MVSSSVPNRLHNVTFAAGRCTDNTVRADHCCKHHCCRRNPAAVAPYEHSKDIWNSRPGRTRYNRIPSFQPWEPHIVSSFSFLRYNRSSHPVRQYYPGNHMIIPIIYSFRKYCLRPGDCCFSVHKSRHLCFSA